MEIEVSMDMMETFNIARKRQAVLENFSAEQQMKASSNEVDDFLLYRHVLDLSILFLSTGNCQY